MLKTIKRTVLHLGRSSGVFRIVGDSEWRRSRLLILGYHGVSLEDEHEWNGALYLKPELFRARMRLIKESGCTVLSLSDAIDRLRRNDLPPRSVALTFDDGTYDFYKHVLPVLKEYGYPATLYLTTFYVSFSRPVPPGIWDYMLWKARGSVAKAPKILRCSDPLNLTNDAERGQALRNIVMHANQERLTPEQKDILSQELAATLGLNYEDLCSKRILHLLTPEEVQLVAEQGISVQLHMHHHVTPDDRNTFLRELIDNREYIQQLVRSVPHHYCYPSGRHKPEFEGWLSEAGVASATTCRGGLCMATTNPLVLPRLIGGSSLSEVEYVSWLTGVGSILPARSPKVSRTIAGSPASLRDQDDFSRACRLERASLPVSEQVAHHQSRTSDQRL
jgi:peptidoglycan/xylan/chitin deacetylase (PgdA/CDA1 family)